MVDLRTPSARRHIGWLKAIHSHRVSVIVIKTNLQFVKYNMYSS